MTRVITAVLLLCTLSMVAFAQLRQMTDKERVGNAELIVKARVVSMTGIGEKDGVIEIAVDRVLKGTADGTVFIRNLTAIAPAQQQFIKVGDPYLFFLQPARKDYALVRGILSIRPVSNEETILDIVSDDSLAISLVEPCGPFVFNRPTTITVNVINNSSEPITISQMNLLGYFMDDDMENPDITRWMAPENHGNHVAIWIPHTIAPETTYSTELEFTLECPEVWQAMVADKDFSKPMAVRMKVRVDDEVRTTDNPRTYPITSSTVLTSAVTVDE